MSSPTSSIPSWRAARLNTSFKERSDSDPTVARGASTPRPSTIDALPLASHFALAERLVQVWIRNQRSLEKLEELKALIEEADRRLAAAKPGRRLVEAHRRRLLARRLAILLQLRESDSLASALVDEIEARRRASEERPRAITA